MVAHPAQARTEVPVLGFREKMMDVSYRRVRADLTKRGQKF